MATTDRYEVYRGPCPCDAGHIVIKHCTPDHPYATGPGWYESSISCKKCAEKYNLMEQDHHIILVNTSDSRAREKSLSDWHNRGNILMSSPKVKLLLEQFEILLNHQRSIAATYRFLNANKYDVQTEGTFRKKWQGAAHWISSNIRPSNLKNVMALLKQNDQEIDKEITEIQKLWNESQKPLPVVGKPIFKTSSGRD